MSGRVLQFPAQRGKSRARRAAAPDRDGRLRDDGNLKRGVFVACYNVGGCKVFHAQLSTGDRLAEITLPADRLEQQGEVIQHLEQMLDVVDPIVGPALVR